MVHEITREQDEVVEALALKHGRSTFEHVGPNSVSAIVAYGYDDRGLPTGHVRVLPNGTTTLAGPWRERLAEAGLAR